MQRTLLESVVLSISAKADYETVFGQSLNFMCDLSVYPDIECIPFLRYSTCRIAMKVAIFYEKTEKNVSDTLADIIRTHQCDVVCYQTDTLWDADVYANPSDLLQEITHILFVCAKDAAHLDLASTFFFGIGTGRNLPIFVLQQGRVP